MTAIDDVTKLSVMRDAVKYVLEYMSEETKDDLKNENLARLKGDLESDRKLLLAVVKDLESIGGAAKGISFNCQKRHPQIPWEGIEEMLIHLSSPYLGVDVDVVWCTIQDDLEPLLVAIEAALNSEQKINIRN